MVVLPGHLTALLVWVSRHSRTPNSSEDSPSLPVAHVAQVEDPTLCWLSTDGMHRKLVLGSTSGAIYTINPRIEEIPGWSPPPLPFLPCSRNDTCSSSLVLLGH